MTTEHNEELTDAELIESVKAKIDLRLNQAAEVCVEYANEAKMSKEDAVKLYLSQIEARLVTAEAWLDVAMRCLTRICERSTDAATVRLIAEVGLAIDEDDDKNLERAAMRNGGTAPVLVVGTDKQRVAAEARVAEIRKQRADRQ